MTIFLGGGWIFQHRFPRRPRVSAAPRGARRQRRRETPFPPYWRASRRSITQSLTHCSRRSVEGRRSSQPTSGARPRRGTLRSPRRSPRLAPSTPHDASRYTQPPHRRCAARRCARIGDATGHPRWQRHARVFRRPRRAKLACLSPSGRARRWRVSLAPLVARPRARIDLRASASAARADGRLPARLRVGCAGGRATTCAAPRRLRGRTGDYLRASASAARADGRLPARLRGGGIAE